MRRQIVGSLRANEGITRIAERILDETKTGVVNLPQHVQALSLAARENKVALGGIKVKPSDDLQAAVKAWKRRIDKLGQGAAKEAGAFTVRSATKHFVKQLEKAKPAQVDAIVERWTLDKARYQARLIARHETVEAYRDSYKQSTREKPYVHGYRWTLSGSHPEPDECDAFASQDLYGLGPGGYPADAVPATHAACLCMQTAILDEDHFERELARENGEEEPPKKWESGKREDPADWYRRNPEQRKAILGPTREKLFHSDTGAVIDSKGRPIPVWQATGKDAPPKRDRGPTVPVKPRVDADRASMVEQLPKAPPRAG